MGGGQGPALHSPFPNGKKKRDTSTGERGQGPAPPGIPHPSASDSKGRVLSSQACHDGRDVAPGLRHGAQKRRREGEGGVRGEP